MQTAQLLGLAIAAIAAYWVFTDAQKNGMNPWLWAIFTFLFLILGLPAYLIARSMRRSKIQNDDMA